MRSGARAGQTEQEQMGVNSTGVFPPDQSNMSGQTVHVPNRTSDGNRKTGASGQASYEAHPVAPQEPLEGARVTGEGDSSPKGSSPSLSVVDPGECPVRTTPAFLVS